MLKKSTVLIICSPLPVFRKIRDAAKRAGCAVEMALDVDSMERTLDYVDVTYDAIVWHAVGTDNDILMSFIKTTRKGRPLTPMITVNDDANIRKLHRGAGCSHGATLETIDAVLHDALSSPLPAPVEQAKAEVA